MRWLIGMKIKLVIVYVLLLVYFNPRSKAFHEMLGDHELLICMQFKCYLYQVEVLVSTWLGYTALTMPKFHAYPIESSFSYVTGKQKVSTRTRKAET
ncbi:hypothetical protein VNO77_15516 [Canavalia gladiata]|uniref:Uncharacterized protein n=1 Tax=Canavalia gladiata TaxID=3824 RepID=A0AAN9QVW6_CANGL